MTPELERIVARIEALREVIYYVDGQPHFKPFGDITNGVVDSAIAIVREEAAKVPEQVEELWGDKDIIEESIYGYLIEEGVYSVDAGRFATEIYKRVHLPIRDSALTEICRDEYKAWVKHRMDSGEGFDSFDIWKAGASTPKREIVEAAKVSSGDDHSAEVSKMVCAMKRESCNQRGILGSWQPIVDDSPMSEECVAIFKAWAATQGGNIDHTNYEAWKAGYNNGRR